jgi:PadR family transcriptional regulator PadR
MEFLRSKLFFLTNLRSCSFLQIEESKGLDEKQASCMLDRDRGLARSKKRPARGAQFFYCDPIGNVTFFILVSYRRDMSEKFDVWQGTLALMILKTLEGIGPLHGYGIARRIEQTSGNLYSVNYGTIYPSLLKLEQEGYIDSEWGLSDNNRKAKYYKLTRAGRRQLERETFEWEQTTAILARFLSPGEESS